MNFDLHKSNLMEASVKQIVELYQKYGAYDYIGENVTQSQHAIQAYLLAQKDNQPNDVMIGALLHDVGHLIGLEQKAQTMGNLGVNNHEGVGWDYLKQLGFHETVCNIAKNHVNAKRYLVSSDQKYYDQLSDASKQTLVYQGGLMTKEEMNDFVKDPLFPIYIKMRYWDDQAKITNMQLPSFNDLRHNLLEATSKI